MQFQNDQHIADQANAQGKPTVAETLRLIDSANNILATFTKDAAGVFSHTLLDNLTDLDISGVYKVDGVQVVGPQLPRVPAPEDGVVVDGEARSAIGDIIAVLSAHGLTE